MQLRMLGRRSLSGSMTIVGDIAQATGSWAPASWEEVLSHLPTNKNARVVELTVNYRTPSEIMAMAGRVLAVVAPHMRPPDSVRATGTAPRLVDTPEAFLYRAVAGAAAEEAAIVSGESAPGGTVAVICPPSLVEPIGDALTDAHVVFGTSSDRALDTTVTLLPLDSAKGLEFDAVIVAEPERLVAEAAQGLRALYVALTRTTRRLTIVHARPVPDPLTS